MSTKRRKPAIRNRVTPLGTSVGKVGDMVKQANRWRDGYNPLRGLTIARAVALLEAGERGDFADLQWTYRFIEKRNATCRSLIARRAAALLKLDWDVKVPDTLPDGATAEMAEAQRKTLRAFYDRVANLRCAIRFLALAEFRGFSHLQIQAETETGERVAGFEASYQSTGRLHLQPLHQWHWVRDGYCGPWAWNEQASSTTYRSAEKDYRADPVEWGLIIREVEMPLDEIALIAYLRKALSQKDWDAFVEIYGIPSGVVILPPNVPPGKESEYETAAARIAEGGSGALPNGSDYKPNDGPRGNNPFSEHAKYQDEELVLAGTSGKLTMLAESGSGTLAGSAHQDSFDEIAETEAAEISEILQDQLDRRIIEAAHPGQPVCAYWELAAAPNEDTDKLVDRIVKLAGIGFRVSAEEAGEKTGLDIAEEPKADPASQPPGTDSPQQPQDPEDDAPMVNSRLEVASRRKLGSAVAADLAPLVQRLAAIETISDPAIRRARLEALLVDFDALASDITADPEAAQVLAMIQGSAAAQGLSGTKAVANRNGDDPQTPQDAPGCAPHQSVIQPIKNEIEGV